MTDNNQDLKITKIENENLRNKIIEKDCQIKNLNEVYIYIYIL